MIAPSLASWFETSVASWFETRGVAALLTMRFSDLILTMRFSDLILRSRALARRLEG
jgi:hypothetical protein